VTRLPSVANTTVSTLKVSSAQLLPFQGLGTGERTRTAFTVLVKLVSFGTSAGQEDDRLRQRCTGLQLGGVTILPTAPTPLEFNPTLSSRRFRGFVTTGRAESLSPTVLNGMSLTENVVFHPKYLAMETILKRGRKRANRFLSASPPVPAEEIERRLKSSEERNWR
jgi:hypothetical protein